MPNEIRPIDANALMDALRDAEFSEVVPLDEVDSVIANAPTIDYAPVNRWISVKDRVPEEVMDEQGYCVNYLAYLPEHDSIDIANYLKEADVWVCIGLPVKVTHWMPLPELPKEEAND